jgi:zinc protease
MSLQHRIAAVWVFALLAAAVPAAAQPAAEPVTVTRATLDNGLKVVVLHDALAPVVTTILNYEAGADDEPIYGLAHATEHMMFRGSKTVDETQMGEIPAITGGNLDADTQNEITQYFFTMPSQYIDIALHLEASRATGLLLNQSSWDVERGAIKQEVVQDNSSALYRLSVKVLDHMLGGTPYADDGLGSLYSFDHQVNSPQLKRFYGAWYHPNNAIFVIVGDVDPAATIATVKQLFGPIPSATLPPRKPVELRPLTPATYRDDSDEANTVVQLNYRFPGFQDRDYAASQVLADVLNSQRGDMYALVASGKALATEFDVSPYPHAGLATAQSTVPVSTTPQQALSDLRAVLDGYLKNGVPTDLVDAAKAREVADLEFKGDSIEGLAFEWSQALAVEHRYALSDDVVAISKVTVADVNRVMRRYIVQSTASIAIAVPKNAGAPKGEPERHTENNTIEPKTHEPLPPWASHVLANLTVPPQTTNPTSFKLANGMTLVVQPESVTHTVVVSGLIRSNQSLEAPALPAGIAGICEALLPYGTTTYDRIAYQTQLDAISASVETGTEFSLAALSQDFDRGVQLLADDELHPSFPSDAFASVKELTLGDVTGAQTSPDHIAELRMASALYPQGDPARAFATPESVGRASLEGVKQWYTTAYRPDLTTVVVVGDVTPDQAKASFDKWFGGWTASGPTPAVELPAVPDNAPSSTVVPAIGHTQDSVQLEETLALKRDNPDYAPLQLANTVLSDGGSAAQLFHDLRDVHGYVYYVDSEFGIGRTRSTFTISFGAFPENVGKAQALAFAALRSMSTAPIGAERLRRAQALLLSKVPLREESYGGVARQLLGYASEGLPLDQNVIDARRELGVTPAQAQAAFAKWVRPGGFVRVVIGPPPSGP